MRIALAAGALLLLVVFAAPAAEAKDKRSKATRKLYEINWGRRSDINMRYWPLHQHPYTRY